MSPKTRKARRAVRRGATAGTQKTAPDLKTFQVFATDAVREVVAKQGKALTRYGEVLSGYGSGKTRAGALSEEMLKLALEQSTDYARDAIKFGGAYLRLVVSLFDVIAPRTTSQAAAASTKQ